MTRKLIFTYIVIWSCAVSAQNEKVYNLNEITVTAGRFPVKLNELSRSVVIIDSSAIYSLPVNSIQDIFKYIGGVDLRTRGNDGVQADVSIHGGSSEETLIMIDEIR